MKVTLPDGSEKQYEGSVTAAQIAGEIGPGLAKAAVGAKVDGQLWDLNRPIDHDCNLAIVTGPKADKKGRTKGQPDPDALYLLRHSCAHVMAEAIQRLWPDALLAYGPPVDTGFYYDICLEEPISSDDFQRIEAEMKKIVAEDRPFTRYELPPHEGMVKLKEENNKYKLDNAHRALEGGAATLSWYITGTPDTLVHEGVQWYRINDLDVPVDSTNGNTIVCEQRTPVSGTLNLVKSADWEDLCMGPHVPSTGYIGAYKVMSVAASYWHGDVKSDRFQRVYGTAFFSQADLDEYLHQLEEAKQRDHRVIGQQQRLFTIDEQVGQGLVLWKPRGAMVRNLLQEFLQAELIRRGYDMVYTPNIGKIDLYKTSGHYPYFADSQFPTIKMREHTGSEDSDEQYLLKPMNCPHHIKIYASEPHSYRDLPVRLAEFGTVYRYEKSGELTGMTRVRCFTQDDAHIFCTHDQVKAEFRDTVELVQFVFNTFGFEDATIHLSLRDPDNSKYGGEPAVWDRAESELRGVLADMNVGFVEDEGEAAFYGPKVDFVVRDVIGRPWQLGTVQLDYVLPERFKIEYVASDDSRQRPVMIHRAPFGSMERFMAILIEHYAGAFPLWLSPEQVRVLPISDKVNEYARKVLAALRDEGFRATLDESGERVNAKVKVAQEAKVNYMLVVGEREAKAEAVAARDRTRGDLGALPLRAFIDQARREVETRGKEVVSP